MASTPQRAPVIRPLSRSRAVAPHVSVVVVNFCQWRNTDRLTRQLLDSDAADAQIAEFVVVDNASPPDPAAARVRRLPGLSLRQVDRNTGFARAANEGVRMARGEWALLLNPDTAVPEGFLDQLEALCRTLDHDDPRVGVVGLALRHADGSPQGSCGPMPTLARTLGGLFLPRRLRKCRPVAADDRVPVDWVTGCGMLIRRDCWADLGGFDEAFFLYYEDADFCRRAVAAGWSVWFEPALWLTHFKPLHTRQVPPEMRLMTRHALLTFAGKHWGGWRSRLISAVVWLEAIARQAAATVRCRPSSLAGELRRLAADWLWNRPAAARRRVLQTSSLLTNCAGREDG